MFFSVIGENFWNALPLLFGMGGLGKNDDLLEVDSFFTQKFSSMVCIKHGDT